MAESSSMTERLANVIYWTASGLAAVWIGFAFFAESTSPVFDWGPVWIAGVGGGVVIWLFGRAVRYVLAGV